MQKEWFELTERWKRHMIRECVRQATLSRGCASNSGSYEDLHHGLLARRVRDSADQWIIVTPDQEQWRAEVTPTGRIQVSHPTG